jgi:hypothetical protein
MRSVARTRSHLAARVCWFAVASCLQRHCAFSPALLLCCTALYCVLCCVLCCALPRAYKEEEKKMGTLQQENIERPDSMTTTGEPQAAAHNRLVSTCSLVLQPRHSSLRECMQPVLSSALLLLTILLPSYLLCVPVSYGCLS